MRNEGENFLIGKPSPSFPVLAGRETSQIGSLGPFSALGTQPLSFRRPVEGNIVLTARKRPVYKTVRSDSEELPVCAVGPDFPCREDLKVNIKELACVETVKGTEPRLQVARRE